MSERMETLRAMLNEEKHHAWRKPLTEEKWAEISAQIQDPELSLDARAALRLKLFLENECIVKAEGTSIPCWRTIPAFPDIYAEGEKEKLTAGRYVHEQGRVCNIASDYEGVLRGGLMERRKQAEENLAAGVGNAEFAKAVIVVIDAVIAYADRYEDEKLSDAVRYGAKDFLTALKMFRVLHFSLWASNVYHNTVGRFDQYMLPYYEKDIAEGNLTKEAAQELIEDFFLSFNRDSDLYTGMQQGDNGQSLMLGGCDKDGKCAVNELTYLCLEASLNNRRIDPKINLRVDKNTPTELYVKCTELTRQGLGFPQYANDDMVIPALVKMGYALEDARNYVVAACWEFIIPGVGMDIPNIGAVSLAGVVKKTIDEELEACDTYEALFAKVRENITKDAAAIAEGVKDLFMEPAPYQSVLMKDNVKRGQDISLGAKYNNYAFHGTGAATAVDQLAAVKKYVYEDKTIAAAEFKKAVAEGFANDADLQHTLREDAPKLGRDEECEGIADALLSAFADAVEPLKNERGGIFRAGTGSAMYYLWHADELGSTYDGRYADEPLSANFSPSLTLRDAGPLSVISAMARPTLNRVMNGGPLTLEMHDTVFNHPEGLEKVAQLVRSFILLGGHQLQLNAVSPEQLKDAMAHPEKHRGLIVRVWGWSGHFVQLDKAYQEQILRRTMYGV